MDVIKSYVAIGAVAGGAYIFYNWDKFKPKAAATVDTVASAASRDVSTAKSQVKKRKPAKPTAPQAKTTVTADPAPTTLDDQEDAAVQDNDKEWARQLQARKTGVSISGSGAGKAVPAKKQNKSKQQSSNETSTTTASELDAASRGTAGASKTPIAGGVSDMLDAPAPAASVLRITGEEKAKKQQPAKEAQAQETKKQRQNRRKVEEQKAQREADEKERQILLETQRRTAREARGEPAKNGLASAAVPASSAWSSSDASGIPTTGISAQSTSLLDTFEPESTPTAPNTTATQSAPTEEPETQVLDDTNGASGWNEVPKGKKAKGKAAPGVQISGNASSASSTVDLTNGITSATQAAVLPKKSQPKAQPVNNGTTAKKSAQTNGFAALQAATTYSSSAKGHPDDSDWAVV